MGKYGSNVATGVKCSCSPIWGKKVILWAKIFNIKNIKSEFAVSK